MLYAITDVQVEYAIGQNLREISELKRLKKYRKKIKNYNINCEHGSTQAGLDNSIKSRKLYDSVLLQMKYTRDIKGRKLLVMYRIIETHLDKTCLTEVEARKELSSLRLLIEQDFGSNALK